MDTDSCDVNVDDMTDAAVKQFLVDNDLSEEGEESGEYDVTDDHRQRVRDHVPALKEKVEEELGELKQAASDLDWGPNA